jgi:hypothetical protein
MIRLIPSLFLWLAFVALRTVLILAGWIVVPIAVLFGAYAVKPRSLAGKSVDHHYFTWRWLWLWDNDEEGCAWYGEGPLWWRIIYSSCWRNPVNNLRYVPYLSLKIDPAKVRWVGSHIECRDQHDLDLILSDKAYEAPIRTYDSDDHEFWYFAWHGWYSCYRRHFTWRGKRRRFWCGHKLYCSDIYGVTDHRAKSAGFAMQFKVIEK